MTRKTFAIAAVVGLLALAALAVGLRPSGGPAASAVKQSGNSSTEVVVERRTKVAPGNARAGDHNRSDDGDRADDRTDRDDHDDRADRDDSNDRADRDHDADDRYDDDRDDKDHDDGRDD